MTSTMESLGVVTERPRRASRRAAAIRSLTRAETTLRPRGPVPRHRT